MKHFTRKIASIEPRWNVEPLGEADFHQLCERFSVKVVEAPMSIEGFYFSLLGGHYIAINSRLKSPMRQVVMFHELAHFLLHAPQNGVAAEFHGLRRRERSELEADVFSICALLPKRMLETRSPQELMEEDGFPEELVAQRMELLEVMGL